MEIPQGLIAVVDVESTCWEEGKQPVGEASEIIEIGICMVDIAKQEHVADSRRSIIVKPARSRVSEFCTKLTSHTQDEVDKGISFRDTCKILQKDLHTSIYPWTSWGDYDLKMFKNECRILKIDYPFSNIHYNLKRRFAKLLELPKELGMDKAMRQVGIPLEGRHHLGVDDAWNIATILTWMLGKFGNAVFQER